ncbi:MAG: DUF4166 domain-containing protein [Magnetospiraceae bacterium]
MYIPPPDHLQRPARTSRFAEDHRFRDLLGPAWETLPAAVRQRFGRKAVGHDAITYVGEIVRSHRTWHGRLFATLCRLVGAPLPLGDEIGVPAVVSVTEDPQGGGQFWTRIYGRRHGFPQVITSSKRFSGPTGMTEYLGYGLGIALKVTADPRGLSFHSDHYVLTLGGTRLALPRWLGNLLGPGALTIRHEDRGDGSFYFILRLRHPLFGTSLEQWGLFRERAAHPIGRTPS